MRWETARAAAFAAPAALLGLAVAIGAPRASPSPPAPTPWIEDRRGGYLTEDLGREGSLGFWKVRLGASPFLEKAILAIEDGRFRTHLGVDPRGLARALLSTLAGSRQGGSTIAMQVVRLADPKPRGLTSKLSEASAALMATAILGRERILELYLAMMPQGGRVYGAAYAARRYFGKPVADLSLAECAILAAIPNSPTSLNVQEPRGFEAARARAALVLRLMEGSGGADPEACALARAELASMPRPRASVRPLDSLHFIELVLAESRPLLSRGIEAPIAASLDPGLQRKAAALVSRALAENARYGALNAAMIAADVESGEILAYVGSGGYFEDAASGAIDYAAVPRSSGSVLKPFLYALGLDEGLFTAASVLADLPFSVLDPKGVYRAANFDDDFLGPMLYGRALANSRNIPALRVLEAVGAGRFLGLCRELGLARGDKDSGWYGYGLAIGGLEVRLSDLVAAYATLANGGILVRLTPLKKAASDPVPGSDLAANAAARGEGKRSISEASARSVLRWLSDPQARAPSFPRLGALEYAWPVAVKTGTSQGYRDAWALAASRRYVVGLWLGEPDAAPMNKVAGLTAAGYVRSLMEELQPLQREGIDEELFPPPEGYQGFDLCLLSGQLAGDGCPLASREWLSPDEAPRSPCTVHRRIAVDVATGAAADERTEAGRLALRPFTVLPPEYALWGAKRGLGPPAPIAAAPPSISISEPQDGSRYFMDPDAPPRFQTIQLQAIASPSSALVEWLVDGKLVASSGYPFAARLALSPGDHAIQARARGGSSLAGASVSVGIHVE